MKHCFSVLSWQINISLKSARVVLVVPLKLLNLQITPNLFLLMLYFLTMQVEVTPGRIGRTVQKVEWDSKAWRSSYQPGTLIQNQKSHSEIQLFQSTYLFRPFSILNLAIQWAKTRKWFSWHLKVRKSQKHIFLKLHSPKNKQKFLMVF